MGWQQAHRNAPILIPLEISLFRDLLRVVSNVRSFEYQAIWGRNRDQTPSLFVANRPRRRGHELRQAEFHMRELGGAIGVLPVNHHGDFDLGGGNQLNVDSALAQAIKQPAATPECDRIPIPTTLSLATPLLAINPAA